MALFVCENRNNLVSMKFSLRREAQVLKAPTGVMKGQPTSEKKKSSCFFLTPSRYRRQSLVYISQAEGLI